MAKIPRTYIEGAIYYVTSRGDNEKIIFKDKEDYQKYLELLIKYKGQYGFKLFAFVLMPNHLHLLIELKKDLTVSDIMHDLSANYTKYFNGRYNRKGHLFQERNRTILAEKLSYLLPMTAYIHLNPKAQNSVLEIKDYPYSSYPRYIGKEDSSVLGSGFSVTEGLNLDEEAKEISEYLKGKSYADFLNSVAKDEIEVLAKDLAKKLILGSQEFMAKVEQEMKDALAESQEPASGNRRFILAGIAAVVVLGIFTFYLYGRTLKLKDVLKKDIQKKEVELSQRLKKEKATIYKDLDEKYRADQVSYNAMAKRLEIEKNKVKDLERKIK